MAFPGTLKKQHAEIPGVNKKEEILGMIKKK